MDAFPTRLFLPEPQEEMLVRISRPAETDHIPIDALFQADVVGVPIVQGGGIRVALMPRAEAADFVEAERAAVLRGTEEEIATEWALCQKSRLWFISRWVNVQTKFPIDGRKAVPFLPFAYQVRGIRLYDQARREKRGIYQEKSRQLGESWLFMALLLHDVLFEDDFSAVVTHQTEKDVDDGGSKSTTNSLLGRLRFMYDRLPRFLAADASHVALLVIKHRLISNLSRNSLISGEPSGEDIARGGTISVWLGDEWAHAEHSEAAWAAADEAVETPILNSTAYGEDNHFARMRKALVSPRDENERAVRDRFLASRVHWSEHPIYSLGIEVDAEGRLTSPYYRKAIATKTADLAAQELDISFRGSLPGRFFPEFVYGIHVPTEEIPLRSGWWYYLTADHGLADTEVWGLWQTSGRGGQAELVDEWHSVRPGSDRRGERLTSREVAIGVYTWLQGWGLDPWRMWAILADPSGANQDQTSGQSHHWLIRAEWQRQDPSHRDAPQILPANNSIADGIESTRLLMKGTWGGKPFVFRVSKRCVLTIDSLQQYRRRVTRKGQVLAEELKDWTNHAADMVRYFAHTVYPAIAAEAEEAARPRQTNRSAVRGRQLRRSYAQ